MNTDCRRQTMSVDEIEANWDVNQFPNACIGSGT